MNASNDKRAAVVDADGWRSLGDGPRWLYAEPGRLRAVWRLATFAVAAALLQPILESVIAPLFAALSRAVGEPVVGYEWTMLCATWGASAFALRTVDHAPWQHIALDADAWRARRMLSGAAMGSAAIVCTVLLLILSRSLHFEVLTHTADDLAAPTFVATALRVAVMLAPAALWEELVFRGYLWTVAVDAGGTRVAKWATATAFAAIHVTNPGASVQSSLLVFTAGWCLGLVRERTNSVPAAWGAHFMWNWIMAAIVHVPVSGWVTETPRYRAVVSGPVWWTGGGWGPEGGVAALIVLSTAIWWSMPHRSLHLFRTENITR